ncbi:Hypothetical predicted protein, partial [Podarcis lilfordi]
FTQLSHGKQHSSRHAQELDIAQGTNHAKTDNPASFPMEGFAHVAPSSFSSSWWYNHSSHLAADQLVNFDNGIKLLQYIAVSQILLP